MVVMVAIDEGESDVTARKLALELEGEGRSNLTGPQDPEVAKLQDCVDAQIGGAVDHVHGPRGVAMPVAGHQDPAVPWRGERHRLTDHGPCRPRAPRAMHRRRSG